MLRAVVPQFITSRIALELPVSALVYVESTSETLNCRIFCVYRQSIGVYLIRYAHVYVKSTFKSLNRHIFGVLEQSIGVHSSCAIF